MHLTLIIHSDFNTCSISRHLLTKSGRAISFVPKLKDVSEYIATPL